jgi:MoaA/NifB/PqqE/SkfB family radical SAM enzyme
MITGEPELKQTPDRITVELTNTCNLSCRMCPRHHMGYPLGFMDRDLFERIVDEMRANGISTLVPFFRGESLLHPHFLDMMEYAKNRGLAIQLATNGILLRREMAKRLVAMGIDFLSVSVDSIRPEEYASIRRGSSFQDLIQGVETLLEERNALRSVLPVTQVSAVDVGIDPEEKKRFVDFWLGRVDRVRIYPQHSTDGRFGSLQGAPAGNRRPCLKPFADMVVYWDGHAAACNHDWDRKDTLGDVAARGLLKVWMSDAYRELRERHLTCAFTPGEVCADCDHWAQYYREEGLIGELYAKE